MPVKKAELRCLASNRPTPTIVSILVAYRHLDGAIKTRPSAAKRPHAGQQGLGSLPYLWRDGV
jgi:hypothetical protein